MQKEITSVSRYLEIIRRLDKAYAKDGGLNNPVSSKFLYRGMAHVSWPLLPGIFREIGEQYEGWDESARKYLTFSTEQRILQHFRQEAAAYVTRTGTKATSGGWSWPSITACPPGFWTGRKIPWWPCILPVKTTAAGRTPWCGCLTG